MEAGSAEKPESLFREIFLHAATGMAIYEPIDDGEDFVFKDINPAGARIGGRILAVDDEPDVLDVLNTYLAPHVERISLCEDPQRARNVFESHPMHFDLLLTDLNMPGMTGLELARFGKGRRPGFPVVVLTGYGAEYENLTDPSTDVDRVLYKPVSKNELLLVLKEVLAERITE